MKQTNKQTKERIRLRHSERKLLSHAIYCNGQFGRARSAYSKAEFKRNTNRNYSYLITFIDGSSKWPNI